MKAWMLREILHNPELTDIDEPIADQHQFVSATISHSALNHRDVWITKGKYPGIKLPCVPGSDASVYVEGEKYLINPGVNWGEHQEYQHENYHILGMPSQGTFAEKIVVDKTSLYKVPGHLNMEEAAAIPLAGVTAYRSLVTKGKVKKGEKVLVTGAGGGVSLWAVQIALALGCEVYVTSGKQKKIEKAISLGVEGGICTTESDWHKILLQKSGGFDVIIDSIMGNTLNLLVKMCNPGARICFYGASAGNVSDFSPHMLFWRQISLLGSTMGSPRDFADMVNCLEQYKIKPVIDSVFPFTKLPEAMERMIAAEQFGKIILQH